MKFVHLTNTLLLPFRSATSSPSYRATPLHGASSWSQPALLS